MLLCTVHTVTASHEVVPLGVTRGYSVMAGIPTLW